MTEAEPATELHPSSEAYFIQSLARGLRVLEAFESGRHELSQSEVAAAAGVTVPSALRIGYTLQSLGYLTRNPATRGYRLGPKVLALGRATLASMPLPRIADPLLRDLRDATGETVKMAVLQGTEMVYIVRYPSTMHPTTSVHVGSRLEACATSTGRAILAKLPPKRAREIVEHSRRVGHTARTQTDVEAVMRDIDRARADGFAINDQGTSMEHRSVGAAVLDASGEPIAAINISVSVSRVTVVEMRTRLAPLVVATSEDISSLLLSAERESGRC
ncbi:IclR family transcriptional regulator [Conexibacter sp. S30A1]|uniref:IclR family transcriptional regulator n=1 Tax=Conexibacter sp. S30A1 TaxID=2937800 RepID=UPI00200C1D6F|nr:IclR family transcriptional regulator C-terminal domain-containing protein [Conexibacter sp. S30A1]